MHKLFYTDTLLSLILFVPLYGYTHVISRYYKI